MKQIAILFTACFALCQSTALFSADIRVAVASNFQSTLDEIAQHYQLLHPEDRIIVSSGASGMLFTQITQGAPFDLFLSADVARPQLLESMGRAIPDTRRTYAYGRLLLWTQRPNNLPVEERLHSLDFRFLALANPKIAPYGLAAQQTLEKMGIWSNIQNKRIQGENIEQTFQFVQTGNADLGFISLSQWQQFQSQNATEAAHTHWLIPSDLYEPIEQQMILLKENPAAQRFHRYLLGDEARQRIQADGYLVETP